MSDFRVIQGNVVNATIAPYVEFLRRETHATINSLYRGADAAAILHKHGKHTQAEIHQMYPGISNPPGRSTHELRSDGVAYAGPVGRHLAWWQQGWDVNDADVPHLMRAAERHGWRLFRPYARGVEYHHVNFAYQPRPKSPAMVAQIVKIRRQLPQS